MSYLQKVCRYILCNFMSKRIPFFFLREKKAQKQDISSFIHSNDKQSLPDLEWLTTKRPHATLKNEKSAHHEAPRDKLK